MSACPRIGKLIGGCKFSPRYDLGQPMDWSGGAIETSAAAMVAILETTKAKTYVRDVCETCGASVERGTTGPLNASPKSREEP